MPGMAKTRPEIEAILIAAQFVRTEYRRAQRLGIPEDLDSWLNVLALVTNAAEIVGALEPQPPCELQPRPRHRPKCNGKPN